LLDIEHGFRPVNPEKKEGQGMATIGVLLSGCGVLDGSEIHEATLALYFLDRAKAKIVFCAPDMTREAMDHATKTPMGERREVRREAARLARGPVADVAGLDPAGLDGLILPGGLGAASNLCDFATAGAKGTAHPGVAGLIRALHAAGKPIGAICIAPAVLALTLGAHHPQLTIGNDPGTAAALEEAGARHRIRAVDEICVDAANNLVTTPAYMLGPGIADIAKGIEKLVTEVLSRVAPQA
jgi:enhancing lycopene biosynthesis protein 2